MSNKIESIRVIRPGSNPDVDSDFHTKFRAEAIKYVTEKYGHDNVSSIITFTKNAAKSAFKRACTIYEIPYTDANTIAKLIPPPVEGVEITLEEMFDPEHDRYNEAAEFREATAGSDWAYVINAAKNISGKNVGTGVHACGIIISSHPLHDSIPLDVDQKTGRVTTQWTYQECEQLGLIKMDFLGLDTVDIMQRTVEYIMKSGKTPPNLTELVQGEMDDPKAYKIFQDARTSGIFQFGSDMVKQLLSSMKPTEFNDLAATTAVARPGPMQVNAHNDYADRKNGRAEIKQMHPEFEGSPVEEILSETYALLIYQEQVMHIANRVAGMTLQEADDLRSAMGKKKKAVMDRMRPVFFAGALKNGYSEEAVTVLWDTCAAFAKYAFNKSHSVAYAMNAYSAAYLKANYPVEFMSSLIAQSIGKKEKTLDFLKESKIMGLKIGSIDINLSDVLVAPDFKGDSGKDILFGISGAASVSEKIAEIIVKEREENGLYSSVTDLIDRCTPLGVNSKTIYQNLAYAGAFDSFGVSRKAVVELISNLIGDAKVKEAKGESLFDLFEEEIEDVSVDLTGEDYSHVERLKHEANVVGLYLTDHPLRKISESLGIVKSPIGKILSSQRTIDSVDLMVSVTDFEIKKNRRGKTILVNLDDGNEFITARFSPDLMKGIDKNAAQALIRKNYEAGESSIDNDVLRKATDENIKSQEPIEINDIYHVNITFRPGRNDMPYIARVNKIKKIQTTHDGNLPIRIRFIDDGENSENLAKLERILARNLHTKIPGNDSIFVTKREKLVAPHDNEFVYKAAVREMLSDASNGTLKETLLANAKKKSSKNSKAREWPPVVDKTHFERSPQTKEEETEALDNLEYFDSNCKTEKTIRVQQVIEKFLGEKSYDFGVFNTRLLDD